MNTPNNKRRRASRARMEQVFLELVQERELNQITVSEICQRAGVNRTTFYANYTDIYALAEAIRGALVGELAQLYQMEIDQQMHSYDMLKLLRHVRENQAMYRTYFKLGFDDRLWIRGYEEDQAQRDLDTKHLDYHIAFFKSGFNAILQMWLAKGCLEEPEEIQTIIRQEYAGRLEFYLHADRRVRSGAAEQNRT